MRWPTRSRAAISMTSARNSAISCCRSCYHARMAEEQNAFAFGDVVEAITRKMIRRHPHVFADKDGDIAPAGVKSAWDRIKAEEKAERARAAAAGRDRRTNRCCRASRPASRR